MEKPTGVEMAKMFGTEKDPKQLAMHVDDFVNNYSADIKGFIEAMKNESEETKQQFSKISLLWLKKLNQLYKGKWYDLRNVYSVTTGHMISELLGDKLSNVHPEYEGFVNFESGVSPTIEIQFVEESANTHRTLQQTFSGIVFRWLAVMGEVTEDALFRDISTAINESMNEFFFAVPMI